MKFPVGSATYINIATGSFMTAWFDIEGNMWIEVFIAKEKKLVKFKIDYNTILKKTIRELQEGHFEVVEKKRFPSGDDELKRILRKYRQ